MGWLITLGILVLLAILPLGASVCYDEDGPVVRIVIGPLRFQVFPGKKKNEKPKKEKSEVQKKPASPGPKEKKNPAKKGGKVADFLPLVHTALDFLGAFRRKLRVNRLQLKLIMAGGDPCDLAVNYGKAWAAVGNLMPLLENVFVIKKRDVEVECDFTAEQMTVLARLDLTITLGRLLYIVLYYGILAAIQYFKIINQRKGGAKK